MPKTDKRKKARVTCPKCGRQLVVKYEADEDLRLQPVLCTCGRQFWFSEGKDAWK